MKNCVLLMLVIVLLSSCSEENDVTPIDQKALIGIWTLDKVSFNDIDGKELNDWVSNSTTLNIDENKSYYRNYVNGEWSISDRTLILNTGENFPEYNWEYEVIEVTEDTLQLSIVLT